MSRWFIAAGLAAPAAVLGIEAIIYPDTRLQVYSVEVGIVFLLGFVILEGEKLRRLKSCASYLDVGVGSGLLGAIVLWNLGLGTFTGYVASPRPGFADAMAMIIAAFILAFGFRNLRPMAAPMSLLVVFLGITVFISNDNPAFYSLLGHYFVQWNVWMSANLLNLMGHESVAGLDYFLVIGPPSLKVEMWLRCSGLDVATLYAVLIGYFAWQTRLSNVLRVGVALGAAVGAILLNSLRIALLTIMFLSYPVDLVESVHTNLGDLVFLAYALVFIVVLRRLR